MERVCNLESQLYTPKGPPQLKKFLKLQLQAPQILSSLVSRKGGFCLMESEYAIALSLDQLSYFMHRVWVNYQKIAYLNICQ